MSPIRRHVLVSTTVIATIIVSTAACGQPDFLNNTAETADPVTDDKANLPATGAADDSCSDDDDAETPADNGPITGAACCEEKLPGKAHCSDSVPADKQSALNACPSGGFCVPDSVRGGATPKECDSGVGKGACASLCIKGVSDAVAAHPGLLTQKTCGENEICTPCFDPIKKKDTGLCQAQTSGPASAPKKKCTKKPAADAPADTKAGDDKADAPADGAGAGLPLCCGGKGTCVPAAAAGDDAKNLDQKDCADAANLCAPTELIDKANFHPTTCKGHAFTGDYTGVCLSTCLSLGIKSVIVVKGDCDADHQCVPCEVPLLGATGAPGCAK